MSQETVVRLNWNELASWLAYRAAGPRQEALVPRVIEHLRATSLRAPSTLLIEILMMSTLISDEAFTGPDTGRGEGGAA